MFFYYNLKLELKLSTKASVGWLYFHYFEVFENALELTLLKVISVKWISYHKSELDISPLPLQVPKNEITFFDLKNTYQPLISIPSIFFNSYHLSRWSRTISPLNILITGVFPNKFSSHINLTVFWSKCIPRWPTRGIFTRFLNFLSLIMLMFAYSSSR